MAAVDRGNGFRCRACARGAGFRLLAWCATVAVGILAGGAASSGCHRDVEGGVGIPGPIASALFAFAAQQGMAPEEVARGWTQLEGIAAKIAARPFAAGDDAGVDRLNAVVFGELRFEREVERKDASFLLLPSVVSSRRGGCVGLSALYLALGERLGLPLSGMLVPGHFFVRARGPRPRNVELLRRGEAMPDEWYASKYGPWSGTGKGEGSGDGKTAYMRPLSVAELMAVHWFNIGNQHRDTGDLAAAADAYRRATREFPAFAEAAASLGAVDQLRGDLQAAESSYGAAARAWPDLPGLAHNLSLLRAERSGVPAAVAPSLTNKHESGSFPRRSSP